MENIIEKKGVYQGSLIFALLFGGPFVTGWLVSENLKELGEFKKARKIKIIGIISGLFFMFLPAIFFLLTKEAFHNSVYIGILSLSFSYGLISSLGTKVKEYLEKGGVKRKKWPVICIIFAILNIVLVVLPMVSNLI